MTVSEADWILKSMERNQGVHFVKIQKTGSSSFGEVIIPHFCSKGAECTSVAHLDWNQATKNGTFQGQVVTLLRDPVDRALSEFFFLRDTDGHNSMKQGQWDFRNRTWLEAIQDTNISKALDVYIHGDPKSPSRNRQALYVLGFRDNQTYGVDDTEHRAPGEMYDWDDNPGDLARRAMDHLENMTAFGITDCWVSSMRAIAGALNWDQKEMTKFYDRHERNWRFQMVDRHKPDYWLLKKWLGKEIDEETRWSELLPRKYITEIKRWNNVDVQFYQAARKRFQQKFNQTC